MESKIILLVVCLLIRSSQSDSENYQLKQVLILSRHNLRTPLSKNLAEITPKQWPDWGEKPGYLTRKGELLEGYMGEFFAAWLRMTNIFPEVCPTSEVFYVYANSKQRTRASAKAFVDKGYPGCNITVYFKEGTDPLFNPIIHNDTYIFIENARQEIKVKLRGINLTSSYDELQDILDFHDSELCKLYHKCDLNHEKNIVDVEIGKKPNLNGPLKIGNSVTDAFLMEYFEGFPLRHIAWGKLANATQWQSLITLQEKYLNIIFNTTLIAKDLSCPLLRYMTDIFLNEYNVPKVTLLVGHDANILPLLNAMGFKPYHFSDQYQQTPIGGKIVFQKWQNLDTHAESLKINYIYQSSAQLRNSERLSLENPPKIVLMELQNCKVNNDGFCPWKDFEILLHSILCH